MIEEKTIQINDAYDIICARMQVREVARLHGMSLRDQACISMATSSITNNLIFFTHGASGGSIRIECLQAGRKIGVRVICQWKGILVDSIPYGDERWMVDEFDAREVQDRTLEVVLTKWSALSFAG